MFKKQNVVKIMKRTLSTILTATTVIVGTFSGVTFALSENTEEASAASTGVLSNEDRGVIYANSRTDFRDETIYFLITTRFYDGDPSNNTRTSEDEKAGNAAGDPSWRGDFAGLIEQLDYIKALGFTAIWITPVVENDSGYDYHGYHAYNFDAVDTRYESNGITYQDLIDAVHAKGMKIIQDVVLNHTCNWGEENLLQITSDVYSQRNQVVMNGTGDPNNIYHHNGFCGGGDWDNYEAQRKTIADDCFDLETENPTVYNYLVDCYTDYINMGVDGFRIDTVKHISRLTFNSVFVPAFKEAGGEDFYMFGEVCTKGHNVWYRDAPPISTCFYTWADDASWLSRWSNNLSSNEALVEEHYTSHMDTSNQPTSNNAFLNGNEYHTPDYSESSGMNVIDFQMHWSFMNANSAFSTALNEDRYFNDSTWNVVYVDSHDYAPDECQTQRYTGGTDAWAENLSLMFTFRGIPCLYYGSEIEFQAGMPIDVGPNTALANTGRAYYGDHMEGTVDTSDFTVFGNLSGEVQNTLNSTLSQHIMRLNRLRQAIPALRKGQYSTENCSGNIAFKRRYTDSTTDSFALVAISGNATFTNIPNGTYVDAVTGDVKNVTNGTLSASVSGKGNMKIYVLNTSKTPAPGRVITNGDYLTDGGAAELIQPVEIETVKPTSITLSKTSVSVLEAESTTVTATIAPSNATSKTVTWTSSNTSVATVNGGKITGVAPGTATITAKTTNGLTATVTVTVTQNSSIIKPTGITMSPTTLTLTEGDTGTLSAAVAPSNATNKTVTWTTSDSAVATVSSSGVVTAVSEGSATITAATFNGYTATAKITVEGKEFPTIENGVYFEKPSNWGSTIYAYMWKNGTNEQLLGTWPGTKIENLQDNIYGFSYTSSDDSTMIIFNDGSSQTADLKFYNNGYYTSSGLSEIITVKGKVYVKYVDEDGNVLSSKTMSGEVGTAYSTSAETISGYTLKTAPTNASGTYTSADITVTYVYAEDAVEDPLSGTLQINGFTTSQTKTIGSSITLSASAAGGSGSYTYKFAVLDVATGAWTILRDFSSSASYTYILTSAGTKQFAVTVKDSNGNTVASNRVNVTVTQSAELSGTLQVNGSTSSLTKTIGSSITLNASAAGGSGSYTYKFAVLDAATGAWTILRDFSSSASYAYTLTSTGTKQFAVTVKDSSGTTLATNRITVSVTQSSPLSGALKVNGSTEALTKTLGSSITLNASAAGGSGSYTYKFALYDAKGWTILRDFSSSATYTYVLTGTGAKEFAVTVKDSSGTTVSTNRIKVTVTQSEVLSGTLQVNGSTDALTKTIGSSITLNASAAGGSGSYTYKFALYDAKGWTILRDFSSSATYTYTLTGTGAKEFAVTVKDSAGTTVATNRIKVTVKQSEELSGTLQVNGSTASLTQAVGSSITLNASAAGGSGSYTYKFAMLDVSTGAWTILRDFSSSATYTYTLTGTGAKQFAVTVKDSSGTTVATNRLDVTVKKSTELSGTLQVNGSTADLTKTVRSSITLDTVATGGSGSYTYKFEILNVATGNWALLRDFSSSSSYTYTLNYTGEKQFLVTVKDSNGTTVETNRLTVTVK